MLVVQIFIFAHQMAEGGVDSFHFERRLHLNPRESRLPPETMKITTCILTSYISSAPGRQCALWNENHYVSTLYISPTP